MSSSNLFPEALAPRLCHIIKWPDFDGYGFNLHAEKSKAGQYIGKVDEDSPAEHAGLREGDRIIEVNGVNIANENHRQVVERIKSVPNETKLLVVDPATDKWYKERKIVVKSTQPNVVYMKTPFPRHSSQESLVNGDKSSPPMNGGEAMQPTTESPSLSKGSTATTEAPYKENSDSEASPTADRTSTTEKMSRNGSLPDMTEQSNIKDGSPRSLASRGTPKSESHRAPSSAASNSIPGSPASIKSSTSSRHSGSPELDANGNKDSSMGELNLDMSASEMRRILAARKKPDPKKTPMDLRLKYSIIQQM